MASFITQAYLRREAQAERESRWEWETVLALDMAFWTLPGGQYPSDGVQDAQDDAVEPGMAD